MVVPAFLLRGNADERETMFRHDEPSREGSNDAKGRRALLTLSSGILDRLRTRDETAYVELVDKAFPILVRFAYSIVGNRDAAQDVVQGVLCQIWEKGSALAPHGSVEAYLYAAVRNESLKIERSRAIHRRHEGRVSDALAPENPLSVDDAMVVDELTRQYLRALGNLTERQRTAFVLRYTDERTINEVAHILGVTARATERLLARATETLRAALRSLES